MKSVLTGLIVLGFLMPVSAAAQNLPQKKLLWHGWSGPDARYVHDHWQEMEKLPFDGVAITIAVDPTKPTRGDGTSGNRLGNVLFSSHRLQLSDYADAIADLQSAQWQRMKDNFLPASLNTHLQLQDFNWYDDARWQTIMNNWRVYLTIAHEGRLKGIWIDLEDYDGWLFHYDKQAKRHPASLQAYRELVRSRGKEMMQAAQAIFPDQFTLWVDGGYDLISDAVNEEWTSTAAVEHNRYALLGSFLDGMLEAAKDTTHFVGMKRCYGWRTPAQLLAQYYVGVNQSRAWSSNPDLYRCKVETGLGIWLDTAPPRKSRGPWSDQDTSENYYSPTQFAQVVADALRITDRYVWIYSARPEFFPVRNLPGGYVAAMEKAKADVRSKPRLLDKSWYTK